MSITTSNYTFRTSYANKRPLDDFTRMYRGEDGWSINAFDALFAHPKVLLKVLQYFNTQLNVNCFSGLHLRTVLSLAKYSRTQVKHWVQVLQLLISHRVDFFLRNKAFTDLPMKHPDSNNIISIPEYFALLFEEWNNNIHVAENDRVYLKSLTTARFQLTAAITTMEKEVILDEKLLFLLAQRAQECGYRFAFLEIGHLFKARNDHYQAYQAFSCIKDLAVQQEAVASLSLLDFMHAAIVQPKERDKFIKAALWLALRAPIIEVKNRHLRYIAEFYVTRGAPENLKNVEFIPEAVLACLDPEANLDECLQLFDRIYGYHTHKVAQEAALTLELASVETERASKKRGLKK